VPAIAWRASNVGPREEGSTFCGRQGRIRPRYALTMSPPSPPQFRRVRLAAWISRHGPPIVALPNGVGESDHLPWPALESLDLPRATFHGSILPLALDLGAGGTRGLGPRQGNAGTHRYAGPEMSRGRRGCLRVIAAARGLIQRAQPRAKQCVDPASLRRPCASGTAPSIRYIGLAPVRRNHRLRPARRPPASVGRFLLLHRHSRDRGAVFAAQSGAARFDTTSADLPTRGFRRTTRTFSPVYKERLTREGAKSPA